MARAAITSALLIDGTTADPRPGTTVIWEGDTISWVGPDADADLRGASIVDAGGGAVLPGLIDAHVHLSIEPTMDGVDKLADETSASVAIRAAQAARRLIDAGITTARDQGSKDGVAIDVSSAQRSGWLLAARILAAGRGITTPGGHGWMIGVEADGPEAIRAAVRVEVERGADTIKIFPTGGVLGSGAHGFLVTMTEEDVRAAVEEAHSLGRLVGAHVHGPEGIDRALDAGVDTVEHGTAITAAQGNRMAASGVALVPTLTAIDAFAGHEEALPKELLERIEEVRSQADDGVARAIAAGVTVLAGTDAGTPFNPPGRLVNELLRLSELGLGNHGAVRAATSLAAGVLRLDRFGVVAPGMRADLMLVAGDPLSDLETLLAPRAVAQDGKIRILA